MLKTVKEESKSVMFSTETEGHGLKASRYNSRKKFPPESNAEKTNNAGPNESLGLVAGMLISRRKRNSPPLKGEGHIEPVVLPSAYAQHEVGP